MATCPVDFDCRSTTVCPPVQLNELLLDYEAKDYASFRQLLLDLLPQLNPNFTETNPSDLGIALLELLAYTGDRLSYFQDAVANEVISTRSVNASRRAGWPSSLTTRCTTAATPGPHVHFAVDSHNPLPLGTKIVSRIGTPLLWGHRASAVIVDGTQDHMRRLDADGPGTRLRGRFRDHIRDHARPSQQPDLHSHLGQRGVLPRRRGTTEAFVSTQVLPLDNMTAAVPVLHANDWLLIEEVLGPLTGVAADANPTHRQIVKIDQEPDPPTSDPLFSNMLLPGGVVQPRIPGDQPLPLLRVHWRRRRSPAASRSAFRPSSPTAR